VDGLILYIYIYIYINGKCEKIQTIDFKINGLNFLKLINHVTPNLSTLSCNLPNSHL